MAAGFPEVQPILSHVARHLDKDVSLAALAAQAGLSPFHLHRVFTAGAGETPKHYTLRLRLSRAAALLLATPHSVLDVALACGFQGHETFCRAFRRQFGITPRAYRARHAPPPADARVHATLVDAIGPCIRLYRRSTAPRIDTMTYSIEKRDLSPQPVLLVKRRVARSEIAATIGDALGRIFQYAQAQGIPLAGHPLTRYSEMSAGMLTMEPAMPVVAPASGSVAGDGDIVFETLPGGPAAVTVHQGPYDTLQEAYAALEQWMAEKGLKPAGNPWERYLTDPAEVPDPKDWKTEIAWPLAR